MLDRWAGRMPEDRKTGFLFGTVLLDRSKPEQQFDFVEGNKTDIITQAWVQWYTMHKIFEGLISVTELESEEESAGKHLVRIPCCNGTGLENFTKLQESFYSGCHTGWCGKGRSRCSGLLEPMRI